MAIDNPQHIRDALPGETTPISARDSITGAVVPNVGDAANAAIRVNVVASGGGGGANVNLTGINGVAPSVGNGITDPGTLRVTLSSDSTGQVIAKAPALTTAPIDFSANGQTVVIPLTNGNTSLMLNLDSFGNGGSVQSEVSSDGGVTWNAITMTPVLAVRAPLFTFTSVIGPALASGAGFTHFRAECTAFTGPGHITGTISAGAGQPLLPAGASAIQVQAFAAPSAMAIAVGPAQSVNTQTPAILAVGLQAQFDDVATQLLAENFWGNLRVSNHRELYTQIRDALGNERGVAVSAANAMSVNQAQVNTNPISTGLGPGDAGTQRVSISNDTTYSVSVNGVLPGLLPGQLGKQDSTAYTIGDTGVMGLAVVDDGTVAVPPSGNYTPPRIDRTTHALLTKLTASVAVIGSLAPNQSVNQAQVAGTATSVNNGLTDAGTQRVTLSSDSMGQVTLATGSLVGLAAGATVALDPATDVAVHGTVDVNPRLSNSGAPVGVIVSTTVVRLAATNLSRKQLTIGNAGSGTLYYGRNNGVASSGVTMGIPIGPGGNYVDDVYVGEVWAVYSTTATNPNVSVMESV